MPSTDGKSWSSRHRAWRIGLYADAEVIGGAERSMLHVAAAYRGDAELTIVSPSEAVLAEAARLCPAVATERVVGGGMPVFAHRSAFHRLRLDLLQVTLCNPFAARAAQLAGFSLRVPVVAVEQLVLPAQRRRGAHLKRALSAPLAGHVAVGSASADELTRYFGIARSSITVIHNGVPDRAVVPMDHGRAPVVGCAARLEEQKSLHDLVDAVADLAEVRLVLVGEGSLRDQLTAQAAQRGMADRLTITGWLDDPRAAIAGLDVFALPSRAESFPLSIVEAMLSGVPVVAADVGSVRDAVVHERTGLVVPSGQPDVLRAALARLVADRPFAMRLGAEGRALAEQRFTDVVMAERYDDLWRSVLARRGRRR